MARGLLENEIFDLLADGNVSELDFSDEEMQELFENEELHQILNDFKLYEDQEEFIDPENISSNINYNISDKKNIKWDRVPFHPPDLKLKDLEEINYPPEMPSISDYFYQYLDENLIEKMVYNTNLYAVQTSQTRFKPTNSNEIKKFIGIHLIMG